MPARQQREKSLVVRINRPLSYRVHTPWLPLIFGCRLEVPLDEKEWRPRATYEDAELLTSELKEVLTRCDVGSD